MTYNIADVMSQKRNDSPMRSYLWRVLLPDLTIGLNNNGATYGDGVNTAKDLFSGANRLNHDLSTRIVNMSIPFSTVETDKGTKGNSFWYYAKSNDIGGINFEMYEYEDGLTLQYIQAWQNLMSNSDGTYNAPSIYKKDIIFYRLSSDKEDVVIHTYNDYFISGVGDINNDYEGNDIVKYAISLTGDSVEHQTISLDDIKKVSLKDKTLNDLGSILSIGSITNLF